MDRRQANGAHVRVMLTEDELQLSAIDDLCNKYHDWLTLSKEASGGRKTRAANRRVDTIYEEIMAFKIPPIKIREAPVTPPPSMKPIIQVTNNNFSSKSSIDGDNSESSSTNSSERVGRTLRPRCRTPSVSRQQASPATPAHQNIRAHLRKTPDSNSTNVLSAALNQQHPLVSAPKIRQLLRADSAQKKRDEEKERQEIVRLQRKEKEERAEAKKRQLMEQRAETAKLKREQRLLHAAEVRKARERTQFEQKLKEERTRKPNQNHNNNHINDTVDNTHKDTQKQKHKTREPSPERNHKKKDSEIVAKKQIVIPAPVVAKEPIGNQEQPTKQLTQKPKKLDETFHKPTDEIHNIEISLCDETTEEQKKQPAIIASWAKAPGLRDVVVAQFSQPEDLLLKQALELFKGVKLPVRLDEIFGPNEAVNNRYLCRTSSAVWTTPHKPLKRTSSDVLTPRDSKRTA